MAAKKAPVKPSKAQSRPSPPAKKRKVVTKPVAVSRKMSSEQKRKRDDDEEARGSEDESVDDSNENSSENASHSGSDNDDDDNSNDEDVEDDDSDEDDDDEDDEVEEEDQPPSKRIKPTASSKGKVASKAKVKVTKAKSKKSSKAKAGKSTSKKSTKSSSSDTKAAKSKVMSKFERLEEARKAYKWWEAPELPEGINWIQLEHVGIKFAPSYQRHNVNLLHNDEPLVLNDEQEEIATFYAAMPDDGPQLGNPKTRGIFQKNFLEDFNSSLGSSAKIKDINNCDFSRIKQHLELKKSLKKAASDEEKAHNKLEREKVQLKYGYALIDGRMEKTGNFNMEPPGLFRGRGEHPLTGHLKRRCFPEAVSLNMSVDACVPVVEGLPGHAWGEVQHDPSVTWLCNWHENVQNSTKYVQLAASSSFKGKSDQEKYGTAIRLKGCIGKVRRDYTAKLASKEIDDRQLGVAMWVIDVLALRVGGEKGDDEADTVGCCSLRKEHLHFDERPDSFDIELEFLGKDSMLFKQTVNFASHGDIGKQVYRCLRSFCAGKREDEQVFDTLTPGILNKHLQSIMKGLSAKVFRTYNASVTLEKELPSFDAAEMKSLSVQDKVLLYNAANRQVAILCNHQRTVSKATETMFENLNEKLNTLQQQRSSLVKWLELAKKKKVNQIPLKPDDKNLIEKLQSKLQSALDKKAKAKSDEDRLSATADVEEAKAAIRADQHRRFADKHMFKSGPSAEAIEARVDKWADDIRRLEVDIRNRDENKEVALGTSKINYMDPRISVAWCKRCEVPIDKIFAKTLRDKFNWAMAVGPDWKFE